MRFSSVLGVLVAVSLSLGVAQQGATTCAAVGEVQLICDLISRLTLTA